MMYRLALDIGGTKTAMGLIDEASTICHRTRLPSLRVLQGAATVGDSLAESICAFLSQTQIELGSIEGAGIGFPGVMDSVSGKIASCPNLPILDGVPLGKELTRRLGLPVFVENDVNLIALGEHVAGRGSDIDDLAVIFVGSGIGCGLILDGKLYRGADGAAGEFGHTVIEPEGRECTCGGRGCLEMYCSGKALTLEAASILDGAEDERLVATAGRTPSWTGAERVIEAAKSGHPLAQQAMRKAFYYLGLGITNLVDILNPRLIILGGGIVVGWPEGVDIVRDTVQARARVEARDRLVIERPILGEDAGLIGAAALVRGARHLEQALEKQRPE